jgi:hypothetical protein
LFEGKSCWFYQIPNQDALELKPVTSRRGAGNRSLAAARDVELFWGENICLTPEYMWSAACCPRPLLYSLPLHPVPTPPTLPNDSLPKGCYGQRACPFAQLGIPETGSRADSGTPAASRPLHSLTHTPSWVYRRRAHGPTLEHQLPHGSSSHARRSAASTAAPSFRFRLFYTNRGFATAGPCVKHQRECEEATAGTACTMHGLTVQ